MNARGHRTNGADMPTLLFLPQAPTLAAPQGAPPAPTTREWVDARYESLVAAWKAVNPPPGVAGFIYP